VAAIEKGTFFMAATHTVSLTEQEWKSRVLSNVGVISAMVDIAELILYISLMSATTMIMIPEYPAWHILATIFFIQSLRLLFRVLFPRASYQTLVMRDGL
jgi:hypothetical protein